MNRVDGPTESLARRLDGAFAPGGALGQLAPELVPVDAEAAYRVQERLLALRGQRIGGWKVGARSEDGPIQGAPLPDAGIHPSPARLQRSAYAAIGLELEVAFRFGRAFEPSPRPYDGLQVLEAVSAMCATIEIVSSRFAAWPQVDRLLQLADLQNHGALAAGAAVAYDPGFPFRAPTLEFRFDGECIAQGVRNNPAGDPRRLLAWAVNHCTTRGLRFEKGMIVTTGSFTGMHMARRPGTATGEIAGLPPVSVSLD